MQGFDWALQQMQSHAIVRRQAWAEKGMVVLLVSFGGELRLCKKLKTGSIGLWAASQDDLLAQDWEAV